MANEQMRAALEAARHALVTDSGLSAFCDDAPNEVFHIDNEGAIQQIDEALKSLESEPLIGMSDADFRAVMDKAEKEGYEKGLEERKSEPTPAVTLLDQRLAILPATLERNANAVLNLQVKTCQQEREIELLQAENAYEVFTNPDYKHDTVRNAKLVMSLQTSEAYYEKQKALDRTKILLQRARIAYQRSRDTFDAYRSIAAMGVAK